MEQKKEDVSNWTFEQYKQAVLNCLNEAFPNLKKENKRMLDVNEADLRCCKASGWEPSFVAMCYRSPVY